MARRKNTLFSNEIGDKYTGKMKPGMMGSGFLGMHQEAKRCMKKHGSPKLFPRTEDFL